LDGLTYYYQENLREMMDIRFNQIKTRNIPAIINTEKDSDNFTLDNKRTKKGRARRAAFNISARHYIFVILLNTIGFTLYILNII
jgi:hypothetical protein